MSAPLLADGLELTPVHCRTPMRLRGSRVTWELEDEFGEAAYSCVCGLVVTVGTRQHVGPSDGTS